MTVTPEAATAAIMGQVRTAWLAGAATSTLTLLYDGVRGTKPGNDANGLGIPFGRVTVRHFTATETETIGGPESGSGKEKHVGQVVVQCFGPAGKGRQKALQMAQVVKAALQRRRITGIDGWYTGVAVSEEPVAQAEPWDQVNVSAPFTYFETVVVV